MPFCCKTTQKTGGNLPVIISSGVSSPALAFCSSPHFASCCARAHDDSDSSHLVVFISCSEFRDMECLQQCIHFLLIHFLFWMLRVCRWSSSHFDILLNYQVLDFIINVSFVSILLWLLFMLLLLCVLGRVWKVPWRAREYFKHQWIYRWVYGCLSSLLKENAIFSRLSDSLNPVSYFSSVL